MEQGREPIDDGEVLYRRVPTSTGWYDPNSGVLNAQAFAPNKKRDTTGISVTRDRYKSPEEASRGQAGKTYYVASLRVEDLRKAEITVVPRPDLPDGGYDPAHAELPDLNAGNRKDSKTLEQQQVLVSLCFKVEGPFTTPQE